MLRNHLFIHLNAGPNLEVGVMLNGTFVGIDGAVPHGDPPVIELILDPDALYKALAYVAALPGPQGRKRRRGEQRVGSAGHRHLEAEHRPGL